MSYKEQYEHHPSLYETIVQIAYDLQPESYLEIGTRDGDSLTALLSICSPKLLVLCDTWGSYYGGSGRGNHQHIWSVLADCQFKGNVLFLDGMSQQLIPRVTKEYGGASFDMVLIDGDHSVDGVSVDLDNCWPLLKEGKVMLVDDTGKEEGNEIRGTLARFVDKVAGDMVWEMKDEYSGVCAVRKPSTTVRLRFPPAVKPLQHRLVHQEGQWKTTKASG